ncbi:MAG TPA: SIS domain-containing protein [Chloroflexia bacterium]|nr:SIS domain-containing protein [Chloroflexia bacterium]
MLNDTDLKKNTQESSDGSNSPAELIRQNLLDSARVKQVAAELVAEKAAELAGHISHALKNGHRVMVCGNGGSAADAQHFAGEMVGRFKRHGRIALPVQALTTDTTILTCVANDFSYDEVFSRQVEAFAQPGDVVLGISTSGRSSNILLALRAAQAREAVALALVGGDGGPVAREATCAVVVPSSDTARIQECHITLIHAICELVEAGF